MRCVKHPPARDRIVVSCAFREREGVDTREARSIGFEIARAFLLRFASTVRWELTFMFRSLSWLQLAGVESFAEMPSRFRPSGTLFQ